MNTKYPSKIVVIGGGTGSFTLLSGLKQYDIQLTALVNMADDGGSTGILRDELGVLPPGDIRQCLVALSQASQEVRDLFNFRFPAGNSLAGHSFGNLFLSAVETITNDFTTAIRIAGNVLQIRGRVLPITLDNCQLVMYLGDRKIVGEQAIERTKLPQHALPELSLSPVARLTPVAEQAIIDADLVVVAPGDLYTSLAPALLVDGLKAALQRTQASLVFVCNLVNKNHTAGFAVHDYAQEVERFIGKNRLDYVLYNFANPSQALLESYKLESEYPVKINKQALAAANFTAVAGDFLPKVPRNHDRNDMLAKRSLIRHDPNAVASSLLRLSTLYYGHAHRSEH